MVEHEFPDMVHNMMAITWKIWNDRNQFLFRGQVTNPSGVVQPALQFVHEYGKANCSLNGVTNLTSSGWTKLSLV